jgi:hypothetical protein
MRRHIRLSDLAHLPDPQMTNNQAPIVPRFTLTHVEAARAKLVKDGLRYDNATGVIRTNSRGAIQWPSRPADHVPLASEEDVMRWVFRAEILNQASRFAQGYAD